MEPKILSGTQFSSLPVSYIYPESWRPKQSEVAECADIPVIDLSCEDRSRIIKQIGDACREYGFFQVINHGVSKEAMDRILEVSREFFNLPLETKMEFYSEDPSKTMRLTSSYDKKSEKYNNWTDYLRLHCYPLEKFVPEWPHIPSSFKDIVSNYCVEVRQLGLRLEEAISESLGLDKDCLKNILGDQQQGQHMSINCYPACPQPELTYGLAQHTDPSALSILLQELHVSGLQILKDGKWLAIKPLPDAFVVNLGDILQALSNGKFKSAMHRAVVNADKARFSIATLIVPNETANLRAPEALKSPEGPYVYRDFTFQEYHKTFWNRKVAKSQHLEYFKN